MDLRRDEEASNLASGEDDFDAYEEVDDDDEDDDEEEEDDDESTEVRFEMMMIRGDFKRGNGWLKICHFPDQMFIRESNSPFLRRNRRMRKAD